MRLILVIASFTLVCSVAHGQPINITTATATVFTRTNELKIRVEYDREVSIPDMHSFNFGVLVLDSRDSDMPPGVLFGVHSVRDEVDLVMEFSRFGPDGDLLEFRQLGSIAFQDGIRFETTVPFDITGLPSPLFGFHTSISSRTHFDEFGGMSVVDHTIPEPSSIALASLGIVGALVHRFRQQRRRQLASRTI